jgi:hypothetical protein
MKTQTLLTLTAILEMLTGIGLILAPALLIRILLGAEMNDPVVFTISRVGGSAIFSLGIACWLAQKTPPGLGTKALITGMLCYNIAVFLTLIYSAFTYKITIALIAAIVVHFLLAIACMSSLRKIKPSV